jgi:site-specific recombinase XerD
MNRRTLGLENLIKGFEPSCHAEGKSPKTIEWYVSFLGRFRKFLEQRQIPAYVDSIDKSDIRDFIRFLQMEARTPRTSKPLSPATIQGYTRTLKAFFSWLKREDYVNYNLMTTIPVPRAPVKVIDTFSADQIQRLISLCQRSDGIGYRNLSILLLLLDSGIRVSELANIELSDLKLAEGYIRIRRAKGGRERMVPIGTLTQKSLWRYVNNFRPPPLTGNITKLFLNDKGLPLTKNGIQQMLRRYGKKAGITGVRCSPHTFRHTFSENYLLNGGDIFSLQKILGHSSLASVRMYINLFALDVKKQHMRYSPVDNLAQVLNVHSLIAISNRGK